MRGVGLALALAACAHAPAPRVEGSGGEASGSVSEVDPFEHRVTLTTPTGPLELHASSDSELIGDTGVGWLRLSELHPGDAVRASFRLRPDGARELTRLRRLPTRGDPPPTEPLPEPRDEEDSLIDPPGGLSSFQVGR